VNRVFTNKAWAEVTLHDVKGRDAESGFRCFVKGAYGGLKKLKGTMQLQYFNTGGYNSCIYAYDSDVLYSYCLPAFFNSGFLYNFSRQYGVFKMLSLWFR
jgi:hypothetical protein